MITITKPTEIPKVWGKELIIDNNDKYCGKILCFNKGYRGSSHFHLKKQESWLFLKGKIILKYFDLEKGNSIEKELSTGDVVIIPQGNVHQVTCLEDTEIFEVSTPHEDSDSYRIEPSSEIK